jgi:hypothetical protein
LSILTLGFNGARAAVITDIHANLPALGAVLDGIQSRVPTPSTAGGGLVGYGPHPNEVCTLIEKRGIPTIYGNYDYAIGRDLEDCGCAYRDRHERELGQLSVEWTLEPPAGARRTSCAHCRSTCDSS